jgi:hypothetical protein
VAGDGVDGSADGEADAWWCRCWPAGEFWPAARPLAAGPGLTFSWVMTSRGTVAMTAITAAAPAAAAAARVILRRRARFLISSNVPGGGGSG